MEEWNRVRVRQYSSLLLQTSALLVILSASQVDFSHSLTLSVLGMYTFHIHISVFFYHSPCKLRTSFHSFLLLCGVRWALTWCRVFLARNLFFEFLCIVVSFHAPLFGMVHDEGRHQRRRDGKGDYTSLILESNHTHTHKHEKRRQISSLRQPTRISLLGLYCSIQSNATFPSTKCLFLSDNFRADK